MAAVEGVASVAEILMTESKWPPTLNHVLTEPLQTAGSLRVPSPSYYLI